MAEKGKMEITSPKYKIGDLVYYNGLEDSSLPGIIQDISFSVRRNDWLYLTIFHPEVERWCYYDELLKKKRIV